MTTNRELQAPRLFARLSDSLGTRIIYNKTDNEFHLPAGLEPQTAKRIREITSTVLAQIKQSNHEDDPDTSESDDWRLNTLYTFLYIDLSCLLTSEQSKRQRKKRKSESTILRDRKVFDQIETYLFRQGYQELLGNYSDQDRKLEQRFEQLKWVTHGIWKSNLNFNIQNAMDKTFRAISELVAINSKKTPVEKLDCIFRCHRHIVEALTSSSGSCATMCGADDLFPALIFVLLKASPTRLQSNLDFVAKYTREETWYDCGQYEYCYRNVCAATDFICNNITAECLDLSQDCFDVYMSGQMEPFISETDQKFEDELKRLRRELEENAGEASPEQWISELLETQHDDHF